MIGRRMNVLPCHHPRKQCSRYLAAGQLQSRIVAGLPPKYRNPTNHLTTMVIIIIIIIVTFLTRMNYGTELTTYLNSEQYWSRSQQYAIIVDKKKTKV